jgi:hypothetical protein
LEGKITLSRKHGETILRNLFFYIMIMFHALARVAELADARILDNLFGQKNKEARCFVLALKKAGPFQTLPFIPVNFSSGLLFNLPPGSNQKPHLLNFILNPISPTSPDPRRSRVEGSGTVGVSRPDTTQFTKPGATQTLPFASGKEYK